MESMRDSPRATRPYDSTRRREHARRTRREILATARELFLANGYAATTMAAIAAEAGVSVETLYGTWKGKAGVVQALLRASLRGEHDAPPLEHSTAIRALIAEPDPRGQLVLYGRVLSDIQPSLAPLARLMREAAPSDEQLAATFEQHNRERLQAMGRFAAMLGSRNALGEDVSVTRARDILWTMNSTDVYDLLVTARGWTPGEYGTWIADTLTAALLRPG
jgi:AcrR family transcriptional regulator